MGSGHDGWILNTEPARHASHSSRAPQNRSRRADPHAPGQGRRPLVGRGRARAPAARRRLPELGALFHCSCDFAVAPQTLMQGASHCDFRFRIRGQSPNSGDA
ncbi:MAG: hypothetical protein EPO20_11810 [Betaproteobacteria bacterium]|nr:MAG: hypothetical protein EPO20_11810 [Betaproteobacteria bacterium]